MTRHDTKLKIKELRDQGLSFTAIGEELGVDRSYAWRIINRPAGKYPRKRLCDVPPPFTPEETARRYGSVSLGCISEALACVKLLQLGCDVWRPFIDRHRCDLAIYAGNRLYRIQVKTAGYDSKSNRFRCALTTRKRTTHVAYSDEDFDFFLVKCGDLDEWYVIPAPIGNAIGYVNLYPHRETLMERAESQQLEQYRNRFDLLRDVRLHSPR